MKSIKIAPYILSSLIFLVATSIVLAENVDYRISVNDTEWKKADSIVVTLTVTNQSRVNKTVSIAPNFYLITEGILTSDIYKGRNTYWAAVNPDEPVNGTNRFVVPKSVQREFFHEIALKSNESQSFTMTISNLKWSRSNSSYWPQSPWYSEVPMGRYKLYFAVDTGKTEVIKLPEYTVERNIMIESNHILVSLLDGT